uniref:CCHC-type domain-containing protein n=1 Tax=Chenopodium quinoa TaxID=63459 RepID=A0A803MIE9_CHEQI
MESNPAMEKSNTNMLISLNQTPIQKEGSNNNLEIYQTTDNNTLNNSSEEAVEWIEGDEEEKEARVELGLVGKLWTDCTINTNAFMSTIKNVWQPKHGLEISNIGKNTYVFQFHHWRDKQRVLNDQPWHFDRHALLPGEIDDNVKPLDVHLCEIPMWVRVYSLPFRGRLNTANVEAIGNKIERFVKFDNSGCMDIEKFVRIRTMIDVTKPLLQKVKVKMRGGYEELFDVKYEKPPLFCFYCGKIGHGVKDCEGCGEEDELNLKFESEKCIQKIHEIPEQTVDHAPREKQVTENDHADGDKEKVVDGHNSHSRFSPRNDVIPEGGAMLMRLGALLSRKIPAWCFFQETKLSQGEMEGVKNKLKFTGILAVGCEGEGRKRSGGVALLWGRYWDISIPSYSLNHIDALVKCEGWDLWRFTGEYGFLENENKHKTGTLLESLADDQHLPWLCGDDFNLMLCSTEKQGGADFKYNEAAIFRDALNFCNLVDLGFIGYQFTWNNNQGGVDNLQERLDRFTANDEWKEMFAGAFVTHLEKRKSDHLPLLL